MNSPLLYRITIQPGVMGGKPTIRGLRFPISDILELLSSGLTETEILEQHPILEKQDIAAALLYASMKIKNTVVIHANPKYSYIDTDCIFFSTI
jgi:uncharacterized protein (DUF433 family)